MGTSLREYPPTPKQHKLTCTTLPDCSSKPRHTSIAFDRRGSEAGRGCNLPSGRLSLRRRSTHKDQLGTPASCTGSAVKSSNNKWHLGWIGPENDHLILG